MRKNKKMIIEIATEKRGGSEKRGKGWKRNEEQEIRGNNDKGKKGLKNDKGGDKRSSYQRIALKLVHRGKRPK